MRSATLGFRGEALCRRSGSVARLTIRFAAARGSESGAEISVEARRGCPPPRPVAANAGTPVEVRDLSFATPARLEIHESARAEARCHHPRVVKRIAIAFPAGAFRVGSGHRSLDARSRRRQRRWRQGRGDAAGRCLLGHEFVENAVEIAAEREGIRLTGLASIPAYSRGNAMQPIRLC